MLFSALKLTEQKTEIERQIADIEAFMVKPVGPNFPTAFKDMPAARQQRTRDGLVHLRSKIAVIDLEIAEHAKAEQAELKQIAAHEKATQEAKVHA